MKRIIFSFISMSVVLVSCGPTVYKTTVVQPVQPSPTYVQPQPPVVVQQAPAPVAQQAEPAQYEQSFQIFYDELAPYGRWIQYPGEGYVFAPNVDASFHPYSTKGYWVNTEHGWTWASDYPWGWAAFHYGRWFYEDGYGWLWLPGHEWGPAWVKWGQSNGEYGWAPLGPRVEANQQWSPPEKSWTFVRAEHLHKKDVEQYAEKRDNNHTIVQNVTIINNTTVINKYVTNNNVVNNNVVNNNTKVVNNVNNTTVNNNTVNNTTNNNKVVNNTTNNVTNNTVNNVNNVNNTNINNNNNVINKNVAVTNNKNVTVVNNNNIIKVNNTTTINKGPVVEDVQKITNIVVPKATIVENKTPTKTQVVGNTMQIYKPVIQPNASQKNGDKPAPKRIEVFKKAF